MSFFEDIPRAEPVKTTPSSVGITPTAPTKTLTPVPTPTVPVATPKLPRYLQGDFIQSIWNTEAHGANVSNNIKRNAAIGDLNTPGYAKGLYQQHVDYVNTANMINERQRREKAQEWANINAPGWKNLKGPDGIKYKNYLDSLPPAEKFTAEDRTDMAKQTKIYMVMMPWAVNNFKKQFGREPNEKELAMLHNVGGQMSLFGTKNNIQYGAEFDKQKVKMNK